MSLHITKCGNLIKLWTFFSWREALKSSKNKLLNFSKNGKADRLNDVPLFCDLNSKEHNASFCPPAAV